ncbi:MAG: PmoA family protein [Bacteroidota bacterium]
MKKLKEIMIVLLLLTIIVNCTVRENANVKSQIDLVHNKGEQKVDVLVDGELFTSFIYTDKLSVLKKPVLYPLVSAKGVTVTRGYPLNPRGGERTDHPHHIGAWLNYGDVNGLDFWGNSDAMPPEKAEVLGTIRLEKIDTIQSGENSGRLEVTCNWINFEGKVILKENTEFIFSENDGKRVIDRITTLTALKESVNFNDTKEGMLGIRVARQLEHPSDKPVVLSDVHGQKTDVPVLDNTGVTGQYLSSEGIEGMDVWGKRAKWIALSGTIDSNDVTIVIMDSPSNAGYPTYWHARGYGLFAANPLGQKTFSKGEKEMNLTLNPGENVIFTFRIIIIDEKSSKDQLEEEYNDFIK